MLNPAGVRPKRMIELMLTPAVVEMARAGYGVAVGPRWIFGAHAMDGLRTLSMTERGLWRPWLAATLASRRDEQLLGCLLDVLRDELRYADADAPPRTVGGPRIMSA